VGVHRVVVWVCIGWFCVEWVHLCVYIVHRVGVLGVYRVSALCV